MKASVTLESNRLVVRCMYSPTIVDRIKLMDARARWEPNWPSGKAWTFPVEGFLLQKLCDLFGLDIEATARSMAGPLVAAGADSDQISAWVQSLLPPRIVSKRASLEPINGYQFVTSPYEHQRQGLAELIENSFWLLAWDPGVGKTKIVADRLRWELESKAELHGGVDCGIRRVLIVCPKSAVISVWPKELQKHAGLPCYPIDGTAPKRRKQLDACLAHANAGRLAIAVINYEALVTMTDELEKAGFDTVVADEIQRVKNVTSKSAQALLTISARASRRWALSGTPAPNGPLDWFGVLTFLDPSGKAAGTYSKTAFNGRYSIVSPLPDSNVRVVVGYQNLPDLHARVASVSSRMKKYDCLDLPPKVYVERRCHLAGQQAKVYADMKRDAVARLKTAKGMGTMTALNVLTESLRLAQIASGYGALEIEEAAGVMTLQPAIHRFQPNAKLDLFKDVMRDIDRPVVVWCSFRPELEDVAEYLTDDGRNVRVLHGDCSARERAESIADFQSGKANAFVAMVQAGGDSITLTAADIEIYMSRTYNLAHWLQSQDRVHRPGQTRSVTVMSLIAEHTVDEKIADALDRKEAMQEAMMCRDVDDLL